MVQIQPTERVELLLPGNLPCLCESETGPPLATDGMTVLLFCDIHFDKGTPLNLIVTMPACYL